MSVVDSIALSLPGSGEITLAKEHLVSDRLGVGGSRIAEQHVSVHLTWLLTCTFDYQPNARREGAHAWPGSNPLLLYLSEPPTVNFLARLVSPHMGGTVSYRTSPGSARAVQSSILLFTRPVPVISRIVPPAKRIGASTGERASGSGHDVTSNTLPSVPVPTPRIPPNVSCRIGASCWGTFTILVPVPTIPRRIPRPVDASQYRCPSSMMPEASV